MKQEKKYIFRSGIAGMHSALCNPCGMTKRLKMCFCTTAHKSEKVRQPHEKNNLRHVSFYHLFNSGL